MHRHRNPLRLVAVTFVLALAIAVPTATASTLYDNGPINGTVDAWLINYGYAVTDSFMLSSSSTITGFQFGVWEYPGDRVLSVDYLIGTGPFQGAVATAQVSDTFLFINEYGYDVDQLVVTGLNIPLSAGNYWLTLQNAVDTEYSPVNWDEDDGPSQAYIYGNGTIPSESFQIIGNSGTSTTNTSSTTPEPGSIVLLASGLLSVAGIVRRKLTERN